MAAGTVVAVRSRTLPPASVTLWQSFHESSLTTPGAGAGASLSAFQGTCPLGLSPPCRQGPDDRWDVFLAASEQGHKTEDEEHYRDYDGAEANAS